SKRSGGGARMLEGQLVGDDAEAAEDAGTEGRRDGHVGGIPSAPHQDPPDAGLVVARVEGVPMAAEIDLEPGAEIHRLVHGLDADIAEIARAIARRDVHAAAE